MKGVIDDGYLWRVRELADAAKDLAGDAALAGDFALAETYSTWEDVLRILAGDAPADNILRALEARADEEIGAPVTKETDR